jgi:hypothetical protein
LVWSWEDGEISGYDEESFDVWENSISGWTKLDAALEIGSNTLTLSGIEPSSDYGILSNITPTDSTSIDLYHANVTSEMLPRYEPDSGANTSIEGGNISNSDIEGVTLTDRWAAFFGNVTGSIILGDNATGNHVYEWLWNASSGGAVCVSTDSDFDGSNVTGNDAALIDNAWGFDAGASDSATNTFTDDDCNIGIGASAVFNCTSVDTGDAGGFRTCSIKTEAALPAKNDILFCTRINGSGIAYNGENAHFELMVPTPYGVPGLESYYFYANLD